MLVVREPSVYSVTTMLTPWNGTSLTIPATLTYFTLLIALPVTSTVLIEVLGYFSIYTVKEPFGDDEISRAITGIDVVPSMTRF